VNLRLVVFIALLALPRASRAFQIETPVTTGCHERITRAAASAAGFPVIADAPRPTEDQHRAMDDLTFTLDDRNVWSMALLLGVRSNDLRDNQPIDVARLVHIHNDPDDQPAHCMRRIEHDGPEGDAQALAACRAFIVGELETAGLLDETLDLAATEATPLYLAFRGRATIALPRFAYRLGRALHALEDGYTHVFRNPETDAVRHVGNWVDTVIPATYRPAVDGYHHVGILDDCERSDPRQRGRVARVTAAATRVLAAIGDPAPGRRARVEAALERSLVIEDGCTLANRYCNAEELDEEDGAGCATSRPDALALVIVVLALAWRPRRRRYAGVLAIVVVASAAVDRPAAAEARWHLDARVGGALDHAAAAATFGIGRELGRFTAGAALEWNPWFSLDTRRGSLGTFNAYVTLARRWYDGPRFSLYSRAELGSSTILFELVGVNRHSTGLYFGGSLLGLRAKLSERTSITFDPSHVVMPMPQLTGFPFYYRQYRITVGLEVAL